MTQLPHLAQLDATTRLEIGLLAALLTSFTAAAVAVASLRLDRLLVEASSGLL